MNAVTATKTAWLLILYIGLTASAMAGRKPASSAAKTQEVDSGTFTILNNGQPAGTETFRIEQGENVSTATAEFKTGSMVQKAVWQFTSSGDLQRYEWQQISPEKTRLVVEPADQFLVEHMIPAPPAKPANHPYMIPLSTVILDDYIFSQREILAWRFLAAACSGVPLEQCSPKPMKLGILNPQQQVSLFVTLHDLGVQRVKLENTEADLRRVDLQVEDEPIWILYLDAKLKLVRILIPDQKTEVIRK
jgi:hypothetical protein